MIRLPNNWLTVTAALTPEEKGRLVDALAVLSSGGDPETVATGAERVLLPMLTAMQKKSKSEQKSKSGNVNESQNSDEPIQKKSKSGSNEQEKKERSKERREIPPTLYGGGDYILRAQAREDDTTTTTILEAWNAVPQLGRVRLTDERIRQIDTLIDIYGADTVVETFRAIKDKPFLLGQNARGWVVMWKWIVTPANFGKVVDGDYDHTPMTAGAGKGQASYDIDRAMDRMRTTVPALTKRRR